MAYKREQFKKDTYKSGEVAKLLGVTTKTIGNYDKNGLLKCYRTSTNKRQVRREDLLSYLEENNLLDSSTDTRKDVVYARVETKKENARGDLQKQVESILTYVALQKPENLEVKVEVGEGSDDTREVLMELLDEILECKVSRLFISDSNILASTGYNYIVKVCDYVGTEIVEVNKY